MTTPCTRAILHTPAGAGGIAVVLLAGPRAGEILAEVFAARAGGQPEAGRLRLGEVRAGGERLDEAVAHIREPELAEIHLHGGPRVVQRVLQRLGECGAVVDASPTPAAAGAWPLSAEGMDNPAIGRELLEHLPKATTRGVLRLLAQQWSAGLSALVRAALRACRERDGAPPSGSFEGVSGPPRSDDLVAAADRLALMRRLLDPPEVVIAGPPNAGKSSLANALLGRQACIVSAVPGTTRDWVREPADLGGVPVWLTDTAGLWTPEDAIDAEAVGRAWARVEAADLVVAVCDAAAPPGDDDPAWRRLVLRASALPVAGRADLAPAPAGLLAVSARTGEGVPALRREIPRRLGLAVPEGAFPAAFTERQARCLRAAADALARHAPADAARALRELLIGILAQF